MTAPVNHSDGKNFHDFSTRSPAQDTETTDPNPLLSLPPEILTGIIDYVITDNTPQRVAVNAIRWGRVATHPHLMTHEQRVEDLITYAKHLDEALIILWERGIAPQLEGGMPRMTAREIRTWMANPDNANALSVIDTLDLSNCALKVIPPEINAIPTLRTLSLNHNQITQIAPRAFAGCPRLRRINLNDNQISQIDSQVFADCRRLQTLRLDNNQINQMGPRAFADCAGLRDLHLEHNQISQIDSQAFAGCRRLQQLSLEHNTIAQIAPLAFADCQALQRLNLHHNQIAQVDSQTFAGCPALEQVVLASNLIAQIDPQTFANFPTLHILDFNNNRISQIDPQTFAGCLNLRSLNLSSNQISQIDPQTLARCQALHTLNLSNNQISQIDPQTLVNCQGLDYLLLASNQISHINPQTFAGCPVLGWVNLNNNLISQLDPQTFAGCQGLTDLHLQHNQIAQLDPQIFAGFRVVNYTLHLCSPSLLFTLNAQEIDHRPLFEAFSGYICRSQWATFYKAISENRLPREEIAGHLKTLEERNLIYEMVYLEAKAAAEQAGGTFDTDGDHQWGEHHVCDDMPIFYRALKRAVQERFNRLSAEQKCAVHRAICRIAREAAGLVPAWEDPSWGETHREENVLRFMDAMDGI